MLITELIDTLNDMHSEFGNLEVLVIDEDGNEFDLLPEDISADEDERICLLGIDCGSNA